MNVLRMVVISLLIGLLTIMFVSPAMAQTLSLQKAEFFPGETIVVSFSAPGHYSGNAWIGIIPSGLAHGSESENDKHDLAYQYLKQRTSGTMSFRAPAQPGSYDFRMHDTDSGGAEVASVSFTVSVESVAPAPAPAPVPEQQTAEESDTTQPGTKLSPGIIEYSVVDKKLKIPGVRIQINQGEIKTLEITGIELEDPNLEAVKALAQPGSLDQALKMADSLVINGIKIIGSKETAMVERYFLKAPTFGPFEVEEGKTVKDYLTEENTPRILQALSIEQEDFEGLKVVNNQSGETLGAAGRVTLTGLENGKFASLVFNDIKFPAERSGFVTWQSLSFKDVDCSKLLDFLIQNKEIDSKKHLRTIIEGIAVGSLELDKMEITKGTDQIKMAELESVSIAGFKDGRIANLALKNFNSTETPKGQVNIKEISLINLDYGKTLDLAGKGMPPNPEEGSPIKLDNFSIKGIEVVTGKGDHLAIEEISLSNYDYSEMIPKSFTINMKGLLIDINKVNDKKLKSGLQMLGYDKLTVSLTLDYLYDSQAKRATLNEFSLKIKEMADLSIAIALDGVDEEVIKSQKDPTGLLPVLALQRAEIHYVDSSLAMKALTLAAQSQGMEPEQMLQGLIQSLQAQQQTMLPSEENRKATENVVSFLENPKALSIFIAPANPVPLMEIVGQSQADPDTLSKTLNISIIANDPEKIKK